MLQECVAARMFVLKLSLKHEFLLSASYNKIIVGGNRIMLQATKFDMKNIGKQNYFAMGDAETFSCDL